MSRRTLFLLRLFSLTFLASGSALAADRQLAPPTPTFARGWFLVRLAAPIQDTALDKSPLFQTGRRELDALIAQTHIQKIARALSASGGSALFPDAFRRNGLDRTYKFHVPENSDIPSLIDRFSPCRRSSSPSRISSAKVAPSFPTIRFSPANGGSIRSRTPMSTAPRPGVLPLERRP